MFEISDLLTITAACVAVVVIWKPLVRFLTWLGKDADVCSKLDDPWGHASKED